jgi:hypothetical protein
VAHRFVALITNISQRPGRFCGKLEPSPFAFGAAATPRESKVSDNSPPDSERRSYARAQYFLLRDGAEQVPVFAFRPENETDAVPALVVDISEGGVQILSTPITPISIGSYTLELVPTDSSAPGKRHTVHLVWSRPEGMNIRSGFVFDNPGESSADVAALLKTSKHHILRCVLHPVR